MKIKCLFSCYCRHLFTNNKPQSPQARISSDLYRQSAWSISGGVFDKTHLQNAASLLSFFNNFWKMKIF